MDFLDNGSANEQSAIMQPVVHLISTEHDVIVKLISGRLKYTSKICKITLAQNDLDTPISCHGLTIRIKLIDFTRRFIDENMSHMIVVLISDLTLVNASSLTAIYTRWVEFPIGGMGVN